MSNQLPAWLQQYQNSPAAQDADSMSAVKVGTPRISLKGKRFKFKNGEEESKGSSSIQVAIVAVEPVGALMAKTFYRSGYNPSETAPPDCASVDGIAPASWIENPVNDRCSNCPQNQFGSATSMSGKKSKACKDSKTLWVVKPDDIDGPVYGLKVPVTSLKPMSEYGREVKKMGLPLAAIITELSMDEDNEYPLLQFSVSGYLDEQKGQQALERASSREWIQNDRPMLTEESSNNQGAQKLSYSESRAASEDKTIIDQPDVDSAKTAADIAKSW